MICFLWFLWHFLTFCTLFEPIVPQPCCILNHLITQQQLYVFTLEAYSCCLISLPTGEGRGGALLHHDLELCSSSFTFGRTRTSSVLHSLNHDLFAIDNVDTLRGILHLAALDVVDCIIINCQFSIVN